MKVNSIFLKQRVINNNIKIYRVISDGRYSVFFAQRDSFANYAIHISGSR